MRRQVIFARETPPPFQTIVHEAALRMRIGGRKVAKEQLERLLEVSHRPEITLRVIPFSSDDFVEVTQTVMYAGGPVPQLDTIHLDTPFGGRFLDAAAIWTGTACCSIQPSVRHLTRTTRAVSSTTSQENCENTENGLEIDMAEVFLFWWRG